jgi:hypothetical protein
VDLLLSKIKSLPENEKELAFSKIREQLSSDGAQTEDFVLKYQRERVAVADNTHENDETGLQEQDCCSPTFTEGTFCNRMSLLLPCVHHIFIFSDSNDTTQTELTKQDLKEFGAVEVLEEKLKKGQDADESVLAFVEPYPQCDVRR